MMLEPLTLDQWHTALRNMGIIESNVHGLVMFFTNNASRLRIPCTYALLELGVTKGHGPNLVGHGPKLVGRGAPFTIRTREYWNASETLRKGLAAYTGQGIESVARACLALRFFSRGRYRELLLMDPDALRFLAKSADSAEINTAYALALCVRHVIKEVHNDYQNTGSATNASTNR